MGKVTLRASGVNHFTVGEEAVLFTRDFGGGWQSTFSSPQAALRLRRDDAATTGSQHSSSAAKSVPAKVNFAGQDEDLESFKAQVREIVKRQLEADKAKNSTTEKQP